MRLRLRPKDHEAEQEGHEVADEFNEVGDDGVQGIGKVVAHIPNMLDDAAVALGVEEIAKVDYEKEHVAEEAEVHEQAILGGRVHQLV